MTELTVEFWLGSHTPANREGDGLNGSSRKQKGVTQEPILISFWKLMIKMMPSLFLNSACCSHTFTDYHQFLGQCLKFALAFHSLLLHSPPPPPQVVLHFHTLGFYVIIILVLFFASSLGAFQEQMFLCDDCQRSLAFHTSSPCTTPAPCVVLNYSWILFNNRSNFILPPSHSLLNKTHTHMNASKVYPPVSRTEGEWIEKNASNLPISPSRLLAFAFKGRVAKKRSIKTCSCLTFEEGKSPFCNQPILTQIKSIPRELAQLDLYVFIAFDADICSASTKGCSWLSVPVLCCWPARYTRLVQEHRS